MAAGTRSAPPRPRGPGRGGDPLAALRTPGPHHAGSRPVPSPGGAVMRTRLLTGATALVIGVILAAVPVSAGRPVGGLQAIAGLAGLMTLLVGLAGWPAGI